MDCQSYGCGSDKTVEYQSSYGRQCELWYTNQPTDLTLCNRCYCYYIKNLDDGVEVVTSPSKFRAVGQCYQRFEPIEDAQLMEICKQAGSNIERKRYTT